MERDLFLEGMSQAAATVNIVTTDGPAGRAGVTVSAMCSVTADAPTLLVCVHHKSAACQAIRANGVFCVNVLRDDQALISDTFAGRLETPGGDKFECADWCALTTGAPALSRPLVAFDCRLVRHVRWGTHVIFIGEVADAAVHGTGSALIYANRAYGTAARLAPPAKRLLAAEGAAPETLGIGCFVTLGPYFMPQLIERFAANHPEVVLALSEGPQDVLSHGLDRGAFGLALTYEEGLDPGLERDALAEVSPYVLLPAAHPLAHNSRITLAELAEEPMVLLDVAPSRSYFTGLLLDGGYRPNVRYRSPSFETVRGLVGHGLGYALLATKPANAMSYDGMAVIARPLWDAVVPSRIVVARRPGGSPTPAESAFLETCKSFFAEAQAAA